MSSSPPERVQGPGNKKLPSSSPEHTETSTTEEEEEATATAAMDVDEPGTNSEEKGGGEGGGDDEGNETAVDDAADGVASMAINGGKTVTTGATISATLAEEGKGGELQSDRVRGDADGTGQSTTIMELLPPNPPEGDMLLVGSKPGVYHCDYCMKDISTTVRIKCAICKDFDLCVDCFCVGVELTPHKNSHPYRVVDNTSFPIFSPDWTATEELAMLAGKR